MLLAIDIGNTHTVLGVYRQKTLVHHWRIRTLKGQTADEYAVLIKSLFDAAGIDPKGIRSIAVSCVVPPLSRTMEELSERYFNREPLVVHPGLFTGINIAYENPKEVGADRIANAVAAYEKVKGSAVVVDFGTATTFDYISPTGDYEGGVIAPGILISSEALFQRASKLPRVDFSKPASILGKDTVASMQAGLYYGYVGLVDGIVGRIKAHVKSDPRVIATGGLASLIALDSETFDEVDEFLTLEGLRIIEERNRGVT